VKITIINVPTITLSRFTEKHDLEITVTEREWPKCQSMRYYATIKNAEIKDGCILRSEHGNGHTPESAIEDYCLSREGKSE